MKKGKFKDNSGLLKKELQYLETALDKEGLILIGDLLVEFDMVLRNTQSDVHQSDGINLPRQKIERLLEYTETKYPGTRINCYKTTYFNLLKENCIHPEFLKDSENRTRIDYHKTPKSKRYIKEPTKIMLSRRPLA